MTKNQKIAHDLSGHRIYPALLFGPTNRAVFIGWKMLPEPAECKTSEPSSAGKRKLGGREWAGAAEAHGNIGNDFFRATRRIRYAKNNSTAVPGPPTHSFCALRMGANTSTVRARTAAVFLSTLPKICSSGSVGAPLWARNLPLGRGCFWAPECYEIDGIYYLFYSADWKVNPTGALENFRIGVARASTPSGPFTDISDHPIFDPGYPIIDANVFAEDGAILFVLLRCCYEHKVDGLE